MKDGVVQFGDIAGKLSIGWPRPGADRRAADGPTRQI
jgi:hypothetical protein